MKEIGAIFVVSISEIRTVQLAAIKRRYKGDFSVYSCSTKGPCSLTSPDKFFRPIAMNHLEMESVRGGMDTLDKVIRPFVAKESRRDSFL